MRVDVFLAPLLFLIVGGWPAAAEAQRNCTKGKPCGNSCISRDKVCRIGAPLSESAASPQSEKSSAPAARTLTAGTSAEGGPAATATEFPWVGSFADGVYFKATCLPARDLAPANRRYFRSIQDAEGADFRRSRTPGC